MRNLRRLFWVPFGALLLSGALACRRDAPPATPGGEDRGATLEAARGAVARGDRRAARALYERLVREDTSDDEARAALAKLDAWDGRWDASERSYREVLGRHPEDDEVRAGLADVMLWRRRFAEADALLEEGLRQRPSSPELLLRKATLLHWRGDATAARDVVDRAYAAAPDDEEVQKLREELSLNEVRLVFHNDFYPPGSPDLRGVEIAYSRRWRRFTFSAATQQLQYFSAVPGETAYNAGYSLGVTYAIDAGWSVGLEGGFGAPAPTIPRGSLRAFATAPLYGRFSASLSYSFMRYANAISVHVLRPSVGVDFDDDTSAEVAGLCTIVEEAPAGQAADVRALPGVSAEVERQIGSRVRIKAGYAHAGQAEGLPTSFQLISLVSDSAWAGVSVRATSWLGLHPLYRVEVFSRDAAPALVVHTLELGATASW